MIPRRAFLRTTGLATAGALASGCAARPFVVDPPRLRRRFARVDVSPDRVIRTITGLRPFRPSGFVVRAEQQGGKFIVHNYGHGGGGITLSWGTAQLAVDELNAWTGASDRCAIVGCGAVGLATARLLQRRGAAVTIYAKDLPPNTTSNVAGGQWSPYSVFDTGKTTRQFDDQFARAARLSWRLFQDLHFASHGIRWIENYSVGDRPYTDQSRNPLFVDFEDFGPGQHPFPTRYARRFTTMLVETPLYMEVMLREFRAAGGRVVVREFTSADQFGALDETVVFNCTGLGARALMNDAELVPVKGQLHCVLPQPEVDYIVLAPHGYMFPRSDGILLGGTFERGNWTLDPDREAERRIVEGHARFFAAMR